MPRKQSITRGNPYVRRGKCVYKADTGAKVGCSKTVAMAKKYFKKLEMEAHKEGK